MIYKKINTILENINKEILELNQKYNLNNPNNTTHYINNVHNNTCDIITRVCIEYPKKIKFTRHGNITSCLKSGYNRVIY